MIKEHMQNLEEPIDVAVCVPSTGCWRTGTVRSVLMAWTELLQRSVVDQVPVVVRLLTQDTSCLPQSRHNLVKEALKLGSSHVMFVDADMKFPSDTFIRLLLRDKDVIGVNCTNRTWPVETIACDLKNGRRIDSRKKFGVQKVQHIGTGLMMVKTSVFRKMQPPLFMFEWIPQENKYCGEDVYFCAKCHDVGVDVWVDHDLSKECGHIGDLTYGPGYIGMEIPEYKVKAS